MKAFYLLLAMVPLTLAAAHYPKPCECPLVKCPGEQPAVSHHRFPGSVPTANHHDLIYQLCKCLNSSAVLCAKKCGGKPKTKVSSILIFYFESIHFPLCCASSIPSLNVQLLIMQKCPTPTKTSTTAPPTPTPSRNPICAGLLGIQCPEKGQACINNPFVKNCLIAADCPGICVGPKFCGGIAGFPCPEGQVCLDVPNDGCDTDKGGRDCGGLCAIIEPLRDDLP